MQTKGPVEKQEIRATPADEKLQEALQSQTVPPAPQDTKEIKHHVLRSRPLTGDHHFIHLIKKLVDIICEHEGCTYAHSSGSSGTTLQLIFPKEIHPAQSSIIPYLLSEHSLNEGICAMKVPKYQSFSVETSAAGRFKSLSDVYLTLFTRVLYTILICGQNTDYLLKHNKFHPQTGKGATNCDLILHPDHLKLDNGIISSLRRDPGNGQVTLKLQARKLDAKGADDGQSTADSKQFVLEVENYLVRGLRLFPKHFSTNLETQEIRLLLPVKEIIRRMAHYRVNYQACIVDNDRGQVAMALRRQNGIVYGLTPAGGHNSDPYPMPDIATRTQHPERWLNPMLCPPVSVLYGLEEEFGFIPKESKEPYRDALQSLTWITTTDKTGVYVIPLSALRLTAAAKDYADRRQKAFKAEEFEYQPGTEAFYDINFDALFKQGLRNLHGLSDYNEHIVGEINVVLGKLGFKTAVSIDQRMRVAESAPVGSRAVPQINFGNIFIKSNNVEHLTCLSTILVNLFRPYKQSLLCVEKNKLSILLCNPGLLLKLLSSMTKKQIDSLTKDLTSPSNMPKEDKKESKTEFKKISYPIADNKQNDGFLQEFKKHNPLLTYENFCRQLRRAPSKETESSYVLYQSNFKKQNGQSILTSQTKQRLHVNNLVSNLAQAQLATRDTMRSTLFAMYPQLTTESLNKIITMLQEKTRIQVAFQAENIFPLSHLYLANIFETGRDNSSRSAETLKIARAAIFQQMHKLFIPTKKGDEGSKKSLPDYDDFIQKFFHAFPRYGMLAYCDYADKSWPTSRRFGDSFIVFKPIAHFNATFTPGDSGDQYHRSKHRPGDFKSFDTYTWHSFEHLLRNCKFTQICALIKRANGAESQMDYYRVLSSSFHDGYIEAQLPGYLLSPNMIQHIHLDLDLVAYQKNKKDYHNFQTIMHEIGIPVTISTGDSVNPYSQYEACRAAIYSKKPLPSRYSQCWHMLDAYGKYSLLDHALMANRIDLIPNFTNKPLVRAQLINNIKFLANIICGSKGLDSCHVEFIKDRALLRFTFKDAVPYTQARTISYLLGKKGEEKSTHRVHEGSHPMNFDITLKADSDFRNLSDVMLALLKRVLYNVLICGQNSDYLLAHDKAHPKTGAGAVSDDLLLRDDAGKLDGGKIEVNWSPQSNYVSIRVCPYESKSGSSVSVNALAKKVIDYLTGGLRLSLKHIAATTPPQEIQLLLPLEALIYRAFSYQMPTPVLFIADNFGRVAMARRKTGVGQGRLAPFVSCGLDPYAMPATSGSLSGLGNSPSISIFLELEQAFGLTPKREKSHYESAWKQLKRLYNSDEDYVIYTLPLSALALVPEQGFKTTWVEEYEPGTEGFYEITPSILPPDSQAGLYGLHDYYAWQIGRYVVFLVNSIEFLKTQGCILHFSNSLEKTTRQGQVIECDKSDSKKEVVGHVDTVEIVSDKKGVLETLGRFLQQKTFPKLHCKPIVCAGKIEKLIVEIFNREGSNEFCELITSPLFKKHLMLQRYCDFIRNTIITIFEENGFQVEISDLYENFVFSYKDISAISMTDNMPLFFLLHPELQIEENREAHDFLRNRETDFQIILKEGERSIAIFCDNPQSIILTLKRFNWMEFRVKIDQIIRLHQSITPAEKFHCIDFDSLIKTGQIRAFKESQKSKPWDNKQWIRKDTVSFAMSLKGESKSVIGNLTCGIHYDNFHMLKSDVKPVNFTASPLTFSVRDNPNAIYHLYEIGPNEHKATMEKVGYGVFVSIADKTIVKGAASIYMPESQYLLFLFALKVGNYEIAKDISDSIIQKGLPFSSVVFPKRGERCDANTFAKYLSKAIDKSTIRNTLLEIVVRDKPKPLVKEVLSFMAASEMRPDLFWWLCTDRHGLSILHTLVSDEYLLQCLWQSVPSGIWSLKTRKRGSFFALLLDDATGIKILSEMRKSPILLELIDQHPEVLFEGSTVKYLSGVEAKPEKDNELKSFKLYIKSLYQCINNARSKKLLRDYIASCVYFERALWNDVIVHNAGRFVWFDSASKGAGEIELFAGDLQWIEADSAGKLVVHVIKKENKAESDPLGEKPPASSHTTTKTDRDVVGFFPPEQKTAVAAQTEGIERWEEDEEADEEDIDGVDAPDPG